MNELYDEEPSLLYLLRYAIVFTVLFWILFAAVLVRYAL